MLNRIAFATTCMVGISMAIKQHPNPNQRPRKPELAQTTALNQITSDGSCDGQKCTLTVNNDQTFDAPTNLAQKNMLAQTQNTVQDCQRAQDWNKADLEDFYSILESGSEYTDDVFGHTDDGTLYWGDLGESLNGKTVYWHRMKDYFADHTLFGSTGTFDVQDINQGYLGNCWFLAACTALAQEDGRMNKVFLNQENTLNSAGIYAINLYTLGVPHTVIFDDWLPLDSDKSTYFTHVGDDGAMWGPIIEKGFAKYHGNYQHIVGGDSSRAIQTLAGGPSQMHMHNNIASDDLWALLQALKSNKDMVTAGTKDEPEPTKATEGFDDGVNGEGLVYNHAYVLLDTYELSDGTKLVLMKNPWGNDSYKGDWSHSSAKWTDAFKDEVNYQSDGEDGQVHMTFDYFFDNFDYTLYNWDVTNWNSDSFLMLDDNTQAENPGSYSWCGSTCTRHQLTLTSDVAQTVYVAAHTWDDRCITDSCNRTPTQTNGLKTLPHSIYRPGDTYVWTFYYNDMELSPFEMEAGESITITTEWNWTEENYAKDWSVTAYAADGNISLSHKKGYTSDSLPYLSADGGATQTDQTDNTTDDTTDTTDPVEEDPVVDPVIEDPVVEPVEENDADKQEFIDWVESYNPTGGCAGIMESTYNDSTGGYGYQLSLVYTCDYDFVRANVDIYASKEDWDNAVFYYETFNADGTQEYSSNIKNCRENPSDAEETICTFDLGYYKDSAFSESWQRRGGVRFADGSWGQTGYGFSWKYI